MLVSISKKIVFLSNPKCGTTSIEKAISPHCEIRLMGTKYGKHTPASRFARAWMPFLGQQLKISDFFIICTTRSPFSKIVSWYKYRSRASLEGHRRYLGGIPFKEFCEHCMSKSSDRFFFDEVTKKPLVDIAIPIEKIKVFEDFAIKEFNINGIPTLNKSESLSPTSHAASMTANDYQNIMEKALNTASKSFTESVTRHNILIDLFETDNHRNDLRKMALEFKKVF